MPYRNHPGTRGRQRRQVELGSVGRPNSDAIALLKAQLIEGRSDAIYLWKNTQKDDKRTPHSN